MLIVRTLALLAVLSLAACADPRGQADHLAASADLTREQVVAGDFVLTTYRRLARSDRPLTIYIEGDGLAWVSRTEPSSDPTPHHPVGLQLAAADPSANVVYLARPCQYTPMRDNPRCSVAYWTGKRFAPDVIASLNSAIDHYARQRPGQKIRLIGYSGGGGLAVLLAARRQDVQDIRTIAGNLDQAEVNRLHGVSPMPDSANAIDVAQQVAHIPQIHFSGGNDSVVPPSIAHRFATLAGGYCIQTRTLPGLTHNGDWAALWPSLLTETPKCRIGS